MHFSQCVRCAYACNVVHVFIPLRYSAEKKRKKRTWLTRKRIALCTSKMRLWSGSGPIRSPIKRTASHKCSRRNFNASFADRPGCISHLSRLSTSRHVLRTVSPWHSSTHDESYRPLSQNRKGDAFEMRKLFNSYPIETPVTTITPIWLSIKLNEAGHN